MASSQFSVVIPVHNGEPYLGATIESILEQSYRDFDLLILENGSTDQTLKIVSNYHDPRIKVFPSQQFLKIEDNWARILDLELNEFITIVCHDDPLFPGYLTEMARLIATEPTASLYHSHFQLIDEQNQAIRNCQPIPYKETGEQFLNRAHLNKEDLVGTGYTMRSRDFRAVGGFSDLPRLLFADALCWARLSNLSYKVCSSVYLYRYRIHPKSTGRRTTMDTFYAGGKAYLEAIKDMPHDRDIATVYIREFIRSRCRLLLLDIIESSDPNRLDKYNEVKAVVNPQARQEGLIDVYAFPVCLYEILAKLPFLPVRRSLLSLRGPLKRMLRAVKLRQ